MADNLHYRPFGPQVSAELGPNPSQPGTHPALLLTRDIDDQYRIARITYTHAATTRYDSALTLDPAGNVLDLGTPTGPTGAQTFTYDPRHRLDTASGFYGTRDYDHDPLGNRTNVTYQGSPLGLIPSPIPPLARQDVEFTYDEANRLKAITVTGHPTPAVEYTYNAKGERVKKVDHLSATTTLYHYAPDGKLLAELTDTGTPTKEYLYLNGEPLAMVLINPHPAPPTVYYYANDHLGTPQLLVDAQGTPVWQARYTPFGTADILIETVTNHLRFPGQYFDAESGLHYNYFRDYDPTTGRYLKSDPIGLDGGLNTYLYANANPLVYTDPDGLNPLAAGRVGYALGQALGYTFTALTGTTIGIALYDAIHGESSSATDQASALADRPWRKRGRWKVITRCNVNMQAGCDGNCPATIGGWAYGGTFREAEKRAQSDANANLGLQGFTGCQAPHCDPVQCFENGRQVPCPRGRPRMR